MIEAPYRPDKPYDEYLEKTFESIRDHIVEKNDDYLCLTIGDTGSGKSNLNLHILDIYMPPERLSINQIALSREEFATSLKDVATQPKPRGLLYDEANVNRRDSMSGWNKDIIDLYMSCRGLNILHLWANPSLSIIDKTFIEDRLRAVILVRGKDKIKPRFYYFFRKQDIMAIYRKYGALNLDLITRIRKKYAWYRGWFRDYNGDLKKQYADKKNNRMNVKVEQFFEKYGDDNMTKKSDVMKALDVHETTLGKYTKMLELKKHYEITNTGRYRYTREGVEELRRLMSEAAASRRKQK
jgi:ABC-type dipeptide/oligopeptide/nickel transport system ATPase component